MSEFTVKDLLTDADRVLAYACKHGRATVLGIDGEPDMVISVLLEGLDSTYNSQNRTGEET